MALDDNYPPYIMRAPDGSLEGYLVDEWKLWESRTGVHVELLASDWARAQRVMADGGADVIDTAFWLPERERTLDFAAAYVQIPVSIYTDADIGGIKDPGSLRGFRVGVKAGDACADKLTAAGIADLNPYPSYQDLVQAAITKRVHVFCMDEPPANYLIFRAGADRQFLKAFRFYTGELHRAVHKGDAATLVLVKRGFAAIGPGELESLRDKWMGQSLANPLQRNLLLALYGAAAAILLLAGLAVLLRKLVRRRTSDLLRTRNNLRATLDALPDLMFELGLDGRYHDYHFPDAGPGAETGKDILGKTLHETLPSDVAQLGMSALQEANETGHAKGEYELDLPRGKRWFAFSIARKPVDPGQEPRFVVLSRDITSRKSAELKLQRLTQLYAALSQCNQAIVRCSNELELFQQVCRDAIAFGGMKMAWVGMLDGATGLVKPVAAFGAGIEYLEGLEISVDAGQPSGRGPTGTAIRENRPYWCQDFQQDPATVTWHQRGAMFGWGASASLPLSCKAKAVGAFTLYAPVVEAFDEAEQSLLLEMAMDISFALDRFAGEAERNLEQAQLHKLSHVVEQSPSVIIITDLDANIEYVNSAFVRSTGYLFSEVVGKNPRLLQSGKVPRATYVDMWEHLVRGEVWQGELVNRRKDGTEYIESAYISPMRQADGRVTHYLGINEDITERKRAEERIQYLANFDSLTGLPNRAQLDDHLKFALGLAKRNGGQLAIMFVDLDHFKNINDTLGHSVGDALLVEVARRLKSILREEDTVSRLGGDEFILMLPGVDSDSAANVAQKLLDVVSNPYSIEQYDLTVKTSIGIALYPGDGADMETLFKNADAAMYRAKQDGRDCYRFFTVEMQARAIRNMQLVNGLRQVLARGQLQVHYQPQVSFLDGRIVGAEALLRWKHPDLGWISPAEFIPVAEDSGLILPIGQWVLEQAVRQAKSWMEDGLALVVGVNLSAVQFRHPDLPELISRILDEAGLPPEYLELELTERVAMHDPQGAIAVMDDLHERGIRMSIDDFGTGYSSLNYLKKFKVYKLKIDQSFVHDIGTDPEDRAIISAIINMARSLDMRTIAEGVETAEQQAFLLEQGCDEVQGYYYSKPLPAGQFEEFAKAKMRETI